MDISRWIQTAATVGVIAALAPLTVQNCEATRRVEARRARAVELGALGQQALEQKDPMLAAQAYVDGLSLDPDSAPLRDGLRKARIRQILADGGIINAQNALRFQADLASAAMRGAVDTDSLLAYGRILQFRGMSDAARTRFEQATKQSPDSGLAFLLYGDALLKAGKLDAAGLALTRALELDKDSALVRFALGQARLAQERPTDALPLLEKAAETLKSGSVYFALGRAYSAEKKWTRAQRALERALAAKPDLHKAHRLLADAYMANKRVESAMGSYRNAYERAGDVDAFKRLGRIYAQTRQFEKAGEVFAQIRALLPGEYEAHCQIGSAAEHMGSYKVAVEAYRVCVKRSKNVPEADKMRKQAVDRVIELEEFLAKEEKAKKAAAKKTR